MSYFLRVEGMNLGNFVYDTNDLATIRGGSLLLLEAMDRVEKLVDENAPKGKNTDDQIKELKSSLITVKSDKSLTNSEKKANITNIREQIKQLKKNEKLNDGVSSTAINKQEVSTHTITKGASWGLFDLGAVNHNEAQSIKNKVVTYFNKSPVYQFASFMVDICKKPEGEYQLTRDKLQTLNRYQQLQSPSFAIVKESDQVCQIDHLSPANKIDYNKNAEKIFISDSIKARRDYGREVKKQAGFYVNTGAIEENEKLALAKDLEELSANPPEYATHLKGKIAFIYIDGNAFGKKQKASKNETQQRQFDQQTRTGRNTVLREIIQQIKDNDDWLSNDKEKKLRLETLLWGGDEIIWVVPAWHGWWLLNEFYCLAKDSIKLPEETLYHGASLTFCHHNAPIHRIDSLARRLADNYSKKDKFKQADMVAYQVLESFDHVGSDLQQYRNDRIKGLTENIDELLIDASKMNAIEASIIDLKQHDFPRRKIYQIVQAYRTGDLEKVDVFMRKLIGAEQQNTDQQCYQKQLQELQNLFSQTPDNLSQVQWLHMMELWDFIGIKPAEEIQEVNE